MKNIMSLLVIAFLLSFASVASAADVGVRHTCVKGGETFFGSPLVHDRIVNKTGRPLRVRSVLVVRSHSYGEVTLSMTELAPNSAYTSEPRQNVAFYVYNRRGGLIAWFEGCKNQ